MTPNTTDSTDNTAHRTGASRDPKDHVPVPSGGIRGVDAVDRMDNEQGHGTTTGADGDTAAREEQRVAPSDMGPAERRPDADREGGPGLEGVALEEPLGDTDDSGAAGIVGRP